MTGKEIARRTGPKIVFYLLGLSDLVKMGVELGILIFAIQGRYDVTPGSLLIVNVNVCVTLYGNKDGKMYLGSS